MGTSVTHCCLSENDDIQRKKRQQSLMQQQNMEHAKKSNTETDAPDLYVPPPNPIDNAPLPPWDINSPYVNRVSYMEMSKQYRNYRRPPDFYDACIRKIRSVKQRVRTQSTKEKSQFDAVIQNTAKGLLRARTKLTASVDDINQLSGTNLVHDISEDDAKFWFQPYLYSVVDAVTSAFIKLVDSKHDLVLNHKHFYRILQALPILSDVLCADYPFDLHSPSHDRVKCLFNEQDVHYIKTKKDISTAILAAKQSNRTISAVGYASSWPTNHTKDAQPLIAAMIPNHLRTHTYDLKIEYTPDLSRVSVPNYPLMFVEDMGNHKIRVGGATPIWLYRDWCHKRIESNKSIPSEPSNAMSLNHSFAGLITVGEHGGGIMASTLTDYVTKLKVMNSEGIEIEYSMEDDEKEFKSVLPHLGLLGIVTEIDLQFESEYYCNFNLKVIGIDKLFPKSKSKKGRTFAKQFEDLINATLYHELFWFPTTNQVYCLSLTGCDDDNVPWQFFPSKTRETNWRTLQSEMHILNEILSIQLLNGPAWGCKLLTKLITKISTCVANDLVLNAGSRRALSIKLPSCDALHLCEFYPTQSNHNLFQNVEWLFPLDPQSGAKILINDRHVADVQLAAQLFMFAINAYNQNMLKKARFPYQHALSVKVIKGSECGLSHLNGAHFYCAVSMVVYDIENNKVFQAFQKEFIETCKAKFYENKMNGITPHWRNAKMFKYFDGEYIKNEMNENTNYGNKEGGRVDVYKVLKQQYGDRIDRLNQIRQKDNKKHQIFEHPSLHKIFE
eukprot:260013_1